MQRYLRLDVHAASSTLAVISESGKRLQTHIARVPFRFARSRPFVVATKRTPPDVSLERATVFAYSFENLLEFLT